MELLELLRNAEQSQNIAKEALENKETLEKELFLLKELLKESDNCKNSVSILKYIVFFFQNFLYYSLKNNFPNFLKKIPTTKLK